MNILYLDCAMGAAGDMLAAALLELVPDPDEVVAQLNLLGIPGVDFAWERTTKCGMKGVHFSVKIHGVEEGDEEESAAPRNDLEDVKSIVQMLHLPTEVEKNVLGVYGLLADAESAAHGVPVSQIHFHEVGNLDAIGDIVAVCMLIHRLEPDEILASPVHVGCGEVKCAHGILPVPAPATVNLLQGVPTYGGSVKGELCTPTGAALLKYFVRKYCNQPVMQVQRVGYGMGKKDFERPNCLRAMLGTTEDTDTILELSCNVDDMTAEDIGFAQDLLLESGAMDVYTIPLGMKKNRPGTMICVLCHEEDRKKMVHLLFRHTTTLGVRESLCRRYVMSR